MRQGRGAVTLEFALCMRMISFSGLGRTDGDSWQIYSVGRLVTLLSDFIGCRGDRLVEVDGVGIASKPTVWVGKLLLGPSGTSGMQSYSFLLMDASH